MFPRRTQSTTKFRHAASQILKYQRVRLQHFTTGSTASETKTALVSGGNRGIGLRACKQLCDNGFNVIMGTRDLQKGSDAINKHFNQDRADKISLLQLDINDPYSISDAVKHIEMNYDGIDVLVNNAGKNLTHKNISEKEKIINTMQTNYYGTISLTQKLLPLLRDGRIICLSNRDAALKKLSPELQDEFLNDDLDETELSGLVESYKKDAIKIIGDNNKDNVTMKQGWINSPYLMSYAALNVYCKILGKKLNENDETNNWMAAYCPGHCATDSTEYFGDRKPSESAYGVVTLSTMMLDDSTNNGAFWAAFYRGANLDSVEMEMMDLVHPSDTISWDSLCGQFVGDEKIQAFE